MDKHIRVLKDIDTEHPAPTEWRGRLAVIVECLRRRNFKKLSRMQDVFIERETYEYIQRNIAGYGDALAPLDPLVWDRAVCLWTGDRWEVLVDLTMKREPVSDLALHINVHETDGGYLFKIHSA